MIPPPSTPPNPAWIAIGVSVLAVVIVIVGWFVVNSLNKRRERQRDCEARKQDAINAKEDRRHDFLGFMEKWRAEVDGGYAHNHPCHGIYFERLAEFRRQTTLICDDFGTRKADFERLTCIASGFKKPQKEGERYPDKEKILETIDDVIRFVHDT